MTKSIQIVATSYHLVCVLLIIGVSLTSCFPSGAPEQACKNLKPGHGVEASSSESPFELKQDKKTAEAGDQIKGKFQYFFFVEI